MAPPYSIIHVVSVNSLYQTTKSHKYLNKEAAQKGSCAQSILSSHIVADLE